jgi:hypothetical protein
MSPAILWLLALLIMLAACSSPSEPPADQFTPGQEPGEPRIESVNSVAGLRSLLRDAWRDDLSGRVIDIDAYVTDPPLIGEGPRIPPPGCPVAPDTLAWLTDEAVTADFQVAGVTLPNRLPQDVAVLRLVVPYRLGFIEIPRRATLRGRVLVDEYAQCPDAAMLFILDDVVSALEPHRSDPEPAIPGEWAVWRDDRTGIELEYPAVWGVEERYEAGAIVRATFRRPLSGEPVRLVVVSGETFWQPADGFPPDPLRGVRREPVVAGGAPARLVDEIEEFAGGLREARVVLNHEGNTVILSLRYPDGSDLDHDGLAVFTEIVARMRLHGEIGSTDPMDPVLFARDELGEGPFLSEDDARYSGLMASGLTGAETVDAHLVSESQARQAVPGACRSFDGQPEGVWLVTVRGQSPTGQTVQRLVFLDATTGTRLCQTETPGA